MKKLDCEPIVLLTATIVPNSLDTLTLKDPEERKSQYRKALDFYLKTCNYKIVFAENSGNSLIPYFEEHTDRVEFLTFSSPQLDDDRGKGYKELEIIEFAINNSKFINEASKIVKITGRLKILNLTHIVNNIMRERKNCDRLIRANIYKQNKIDSRCFLFSKGFWPILKERGNSININYSFESALWDSINVYHPQNSYKQFVSPLRIDGVSGGFGTSYNDNSVKFLVKKLRHSFLNHFSNYFFP